MCFRGAKIAVIYRRMMETLAQDPWSPAHLGDPVGTEQASDLARLAGEDKALALYAQSVQTILHPAVLLSSSPILPQR